jgi:hypothetical protein
MRPLLLAFVDSGFFKLIGGVFVFLLLLVVGGGVLLVVGLARAGRRKQQRLRAAPAPASWLQRLSAIGLMLPAVVLAFICFCLGVMWMVETIGDYQQALAYQAALQAKTARVSQQLTGRYELADTVLRAPEPAWHADANGWPLADTTLPRKDRLNDGRAPHVELDLQANGIFNYQSNIIGDATGARTTGRWRVVPGYVDVQTVDGLRSLHSYELFFYGSLPDSSQHARLQGSVTAYPDELRVYLVGEYSIRGNPVRFELKKASAATDAL